MRKLLLLPLGILLLPFQAQAQVYLSPEDVLVRDQQSLYEIPTSSREAQAAAERQEQERTSKERPTMKEWWLEPETSSSSSAAAPAVEPTPPPAAHEGPTDDSGTDDLSDLDPVTIRFLRRLNSRAENPQAFLSTDQTAGTQHSGALHAGADLAGSGMGTIAMIAAGMGVIAWTILRSRRMKGWRR